MLSWWLSVSLVGSFRGLSVKRDDVVGDMASVWRITATRWLRMWQVRPKPSRTRIVVGQNNTGRNEAEEAGRDRSSRGCRPWPAGAFSGGSEFCTTASHQTVLSIQLGASSRTPLRPQVADVQRQTFYPCPALQCCGDFLG